MQRDEATNMTYIVRAEDKETKNHKEVDGSIISGFMPEIPNSKMCPVQSFLTYLYSLSPDSNSLWQSPKFTEFPANPRIRHWYGLTPVGHNPLEVFVSKIADKCGLKEHKYTNHCLRVTAINILTEHQFSNKEIMAITGHKSSSSLEIYQRVGKESKIKMGKTLGTTLITKPQLAIEAPDQILAIEAPQKSPLKAIENVQETSTIDNNALQNLVNLPEKENQLVPYDSNTVEFEQEDPLGLPDEQLIKIIQDCEEANE